MASKQFTVRLTALQPKLDRLLIAASTRGYSKRALIALALSVVAADTNRKAVRRG